MNRRQSHQDNERSEAGTSARARAKAKIAVHSSEAKPYDQTASPVLVEIHLRESFTGDIEGESPVRALQVIRDDIIPLISEYCFEDYRTMARILGDEIIDTNLLVPAAAVMNNADAMYLALLRLVSAEGAPAAREDTSMDIAA